MNALRKEELKKISTEINMLSDRLQSVIDDESEAREGMKDPDKIEQSEAAEEAISNAKEALDQATSELDGIE